MPRQPRGPKSSNVTAGVAPTAGRPHWLIPLTGGYQVATAVTKGDVVAYLEKLGDHLWVVPRRDLKDRTFQSAMEAAAAFTSLLEQEDLGTDPSDPRLFWLLPYKNGRRLCNAAAGGDVLGFMQEDGDAWHINRDDLLLTGYAGKWEAADALVEILQREGKLPVSEKQQAKMKLLTWKGSVATDPAPDDDAPDGPAPSDFDQPPPGGVAEFSITQT